MSRKSCIDMSGILYNHVADEQLAAVLAQVCKAWSTCWYDIMPAACHGCRYGTTRHSHARGHSQRASRDCLKRRAGGLQQQQAHSLVTDTHNLCSSLSAAGFMGKPCVVFDYPHMVSANGVWVDGADKGDPGHSAVCRGVWHCKQHALPWLQARPMTSNRGAGFSSAPRGKFDPLAGRSALGPGEESPWRNLQQVDSALGAVHGCSRTVSSNGVAQQVH
jgi:hypothetical protein